jgi:SagB-type dehydrogenase family enzyme
MNIYIKKVDQLLGKSNTMWHRFHKHSSIKEQKISNSFQNAKTPLNWNKVFFKGYARMPEIKLPKPKLDKKTTLIYSLNNRRSDRDYSDRLVTIQQISTLLKFTVGINEFSLNNQRNRYYPSAGSRYPIETYLLINRAEIKSGVYHYYVRNHSLEYLDKTNRTELQSMFIQKWIKKASLLLMLTSQFKRTVNKYGERGYRYSLFEAGHIGQNIYLVTSSLKLSCCAIGGFYDDKVNKKLGLQNIEEEVLYIFAIGAKI